MTRIVIILAAILFTLPLRGQYFKSDEPFAHTFSIVARDASTGEMAVGVQSHWFSVGSIVSWAKAGVGVVATQSFVNPSYGPKGLELMESGKTASEALHELVMEDEGQDFRQVAFLDVNGDVSAYTGKNCIKYADHKTGVNYSVQSNMMLTDQVSEAMAAAFENNASLPLPERIVKVLFAAQEAGGDIRGKQSAVLLVVDGEKTTNEWEDPKINLRVDDHPDPVGELSRLLNVFRAYEHMNNGDLAVEHGDMELALKEYGTAEAMFPNNLEMKFWKAISLANNGRIEEAKPILKGVFEMDKNWLELTRRLPASGLLNLSEDQFNQILSLLE